MNRVLMFLMSTALLGGGIGCAHNLAGADLNRSLEARHLAGDLNVGAVDLKGKVDFSAEFVTIRAGSFKMGSPLSESGRDSDEIQHEVTISKDFEIQSTVVTQSQFLGVMGYNPSYFNSKSYCQGDYTQINGVDLCPNNPVDGVSWNEAQDFIKKMNVADERYQYRLPTEAEWEYSARGGSQAAYWYGNDSQRLDDYVWYSANSGEQPHAVRTKPANSFGVYDAQGNVWQWVQDWYGEYSKSPQTDPAGATSGLYRVARGGAWYGQAQLARVANRMGNVPSNGVFGFRLVRTPR